MSDDWHEYIELCVHLDETDYLFPELSRNSDVSRWRYLLSICHSVYHDDCHKNKLNPLSILMQALPVVGASSV